MRPISKGFPIADKGLATSIRFLATGKGPGTGSHFPNTGGHLPHRRQSLPRHRRSPSSIAGIRIFIAGNHPSAASDHFPATSKKSPRPENPSGDFAKYISAFAIRSAPSAKRRCGSAVYAAFLALDWAIRVLAPLTASTMASTNSSTASRACRLDAKMSPPFMISSIFA